MREELLHQAISLFDTPEKWNAFVDLCYEKNTIVQQWMDTCLDKVLDLFHQTPGNEYFTFERGTNSYGTTIVLRPREMKECGLRWQILFSANSKSYAHLVLGTDVYDGRQVRAYLERNPVLLRALPPHQELPYSDWYIFGYNMCPISASIVAPEAYQAFDKQMYRWYTHRDQVAQEIFDGYLRDLLRREVAMEMMAAVEGCPLLT